MAKVENRHLEVACQQILVSDASVYSVQWLDLPARYAAQVTAPMLLERYLAFVSRFTRRLIRPALTREGVQFRVLSTSLALLSFSPPQLEVLEDGEALHLSICGGFLVQAGECDRGKFSLYSTRIDDGLRIMVQLSDYCPLLLGSRAPSKIRRHLYRLTQAYIHKVVTVRYLARLYRDLTGEEICVKVKKVQLREGIET